MSSDGESYINTYLTETSIIASQIDHRAISALIDQITWVQAARGMVYVLGLGGSLANASHLAADLRERARVRAHAPDSLPELTAYVNDYGWGAMFTRWLDVRLPEARDLVLVLSVGGGGIPHVGTSKPLANAIRQGQYYRARTAAIVGEPGGECLELADVTVLIPAVAPERKTEHCEGWQGIIHHLIVGHPRLRRPS